MTSDFHMPNKKMFDFVSLLFFGFTLAKKLRNYDFESHLNNLIIFDQKNDVRVEYVQSNNV